MKTTNTGQQNEECGALVATGSSGQPFILYYMHHVFGT